MGGLKSLGKSISKAWKKYVTGSYYQDKANKALSEEADRQANERQNMSNWLTGVQTGLDNQKRDYLNAVLNANSTGNAYLNNYLANLHGLADVNYNQGVTALQRNIANTENTIRNQMANRGISGAGVDFRNLVNSQGALARGISALQAQKMRDNASLAETKYNAGSNVNNTNWNRLQSYYNYNPAMSQAQALQYNLMAGNLNPSEYTQNLINQYQNKANNPALGQVVSAAVNAAAGNWLGAAGNLLGLGNKKSSSYSTPTYVPNNYDNMTLSLNPTSNYQYNWLGSSQTPYYNPNQLELKYV